MITYKFIDDLEKQIYSGFSDHCINTTFTDSEKISHIEGITKIELPVVGIKKEDLKACVKRGNILFIEGETGPYKIKKHYTLKETADIESIQMKLELGILTIKIKEKTNLIKTIEIK